MSYLHCPRCRLAIDTRGREPILEYCPRCAARSRTLSELVVSSSRALHRPRQTPTAGSSAPVDEPSLSATGTEV